MAIAVFDYAAWQAEYPEFAVVTQPQAQGAFNLATLYLDNTDGSPVTDVTQRLTLLNLLTAHIIALRGTFGPTGFVYGTPTGIVGRVSEASEGSVRVKSDIGAVAGSEAWYAQTQYGFTYWTLTAAFRKAFYVPGPVPNFEPFNGWPAWPR